MIDLDHFALQTAGDTVLQQELLGLFLGQLEDLDARLATMETPGCDKVASEIPMILHRVRGAAAAIGASDLAAVLAGTEDRLSDVASGSGPCAALRPAIQAAIADASDLIVSPRDGGLAKARESR